MKQVRITITALVEDDARLDQIEQMAGAAFVQVEDPGDEVALTTANVEMKVDVRTRR